MDDIQRSKLNEMIQENNVPDNTMTIQEKKHSIPIKEDLKKILLLIQQIGYGDYNLLDKACSPHCQFLISNYDYIYKKLLKNQIDLTILNKFILCLESIENGVKTQHEASYEIGILLKQMYIDPKIYEETTKREGKNISWKDYKNK
jgi:hypothetical protein